MAILNEWLKYSPLPCENMPLSSINGDNDSNWK